MFKFNRISFSILIILIFLAMAPAFALDNQTDGFQTNSSGDLLSTADIYVDSSSNQSGDGSLDNPYNKLENIRIEPDTIVHLSSGEYTYKSFRSLNNVTIEGSGADNTIVNCNHLEISANDLVLKNLTIIGATFKSMGNFKADNVIFKDGVGHPLDEYGNSYGGSIYTSYGENDGAIHSVSLTGCCFINNVAEYGGAIYVDKDYLEIINCCFINNHALGYGGAISVINANKVTIKKSKFINDYSEDDAGGAIYIMAATLQAEDLNITNCSATFGAAITGLNAKLDINNLYAFNNHAKYDGGAVYQMYGTSLITSSDFIENTARNGGALFLDNVTQLLLISNSFINNSARNCAGAIYSISNVIYSNLGNDYENNHASIENDFYNVSTIDSIMRSCNYTIFNYTAQGNVILPSYYNLVDEGYVTPVKDQQDSGNCWSFAVLAALESCLLKATGTTYDLSEENMKNLMASFSDYGWQVDVNEGGYDDMGVGYLAGWLGPVFEVDDKFDDNSALSALLDPLFHIQNVVYLKRDDYLDNDAIKEAILKYGAVATGIYYSGFYLLGNSYYYYDTIMPSNHAVTIVGWDDTYSRYNFNHMPIGDGAFIVKNSWGTDWGDDGYFYVSYYDTKFAQVGKDEVSYTFILNDTMRYDKNYQYDISGKTDYLITGEDVIWYQNIFNATDDEYLAAVSTYFNSVTDWDVSIYVNGIFKLNKVGHSPAGYYTINLGDLIHLNQGDEFKVVFKISAEEFANIPIVETRYMNKLTCGYGVSFFSFDGQNWIDLFNYSFSDFNHRYLSQFASIKAFTIFNALNSTIKLEISDKGFQSANIKATVKDQYGNLITCGNVTFIVEGNPYTVNVSNGIAILHHVFKNKSKSIISATFNSESYSPSSDVCEIEFFDADITFNVNDIAYGEYLYVRISLPDGNGSFLTDEVYLTVANKTQSIHVSGDKSYRIPFLVDAGQYEVTVYYNSSLNKTKVVNVSRATVNMDLNVDEKRENVTINVAFSKAINEMVVINVSGEIYRLNTTLGKCSLFLDNLDYGTHEIRVLFENNNYNSVYRNKTIQTNVYKTRISFVEIDYTDADVVYVVNLAKLDDAPLMGEEMTFTINNSVYSNRTDSKGNARFVLKLINGRYVGTSRFVGHGDIVGCIFEDNVIVNRTPVVIENVEVPSQMVIYESGLATITFSDNAHGNLKILLDNANEVDENITDSQYSFPLTNLSLGNHRLKIIYNGIEGYSYDNAFTIAVNKITSAIELQSDIGFAGQSNSIVFKLPDIATGYLFIDVAGKNYYCQIKDGQATVKIDGLTEGKKSIAYSYDGDSNCLASNGVLSYDVVQKYKLSGNNDISMMYTDGSSYAVRVSQYDGGSVNGFVVMRIDGKSYNVNIDKNGIASFKINLKPKTYTITAEYANVKVSNKIIVKSILSSKNVNIKKSAKKLVLKASLSKVNGKFLKGKKVIFKFNGKKYTAKTNKKGVAKVTIKKNVIKKLKANKKYSVKISYLDDSINKIVKIKK